MEWLPNEVLFSVLRYLKPSELLNYSQTSKYHYKLVNDDCVWKRVCQETTPLHALTKLPKEKFKDFYALYLHSFAFLLGFWHADYPLFTGQLTQFDFVDNGLAIYKLSTENSTFYNSVFSLNPRITIDQAHVNVEKSQIMLLSMRKLPSDTFSESEHLNETSNRQEWPNKKSYYGHQLMLSCSTMAEPHPAFLQQINLTSRQGLPAAFGVHISSARM